MVYIGAYQHPRNDQRDTRPRIALLSCTWYTVDTPARGSRIPSISCNVDDTYDKLPFPREVLKHLAPWDLPTRSNVLWIL